MALVAIVPGDQDRPPLRVGRRRVPYPLDATSARRWGCTPVEVFRGAVEGRHPGALAPVAERGGWGGGVRGPRVERRTQVDGAQAHVGPAQDLADAPSPLRLAVVACTPCSPGRHQRRRGSDAAFITASRRGAANAPATAPPTSSRPPRAAPPRPPTRSRPPRLFVTRTPTPGAVAWVGWLGQRGRQLDAPDPRSTGRRACRRHRPPPALVHARHGDAPHRRRGHAAGDQPRRAACWAGEREATIRGMTSRLPGARWPRSRAGDTPESLRSPT
jgi:hypothetical protein